MKTVYKYPLDITDEQTVWLPKDAEILKIADQQDRLCLWALVEKDAPTYQKIIRVHGTGHNVADEGLKHLDTVLMGSLVWHVFEVI